MVGPGSYRNHILPKQTPLMDAPLQGSIHQVITPRKTVMMNPDKFPWEDEKLYPPSLRNPSSKAKSIFDSLWV